MSIEKNSSIVCVENDLFTYNEVDEPVSFDKAKEFCQESGSTLARIDNANELAIVNQLRKTNLNSWIGVRSLGKQDNLDLTPKDFFFTDGSTEDVAFFQDVEIGKFPWSVGEPTSTVEFNEHCVQIFLDSGLWNNVPCDNKAETFVCRSVNSKQCDSVGKENNSSTSVVVGGIVGGISVLTFLIVLYFIFKPKKELFILHEHPKGTRPCEISGIAPPKSNIGMHPYLRPEPVTYSYNENEYSDMSLASSVVSDVFSVDSTGYNYRHSYC